MKGQKLVSVIVPVYNAENILDKCVDSLISQTYENLEIMLVDDGSTDKSFDICKKYASKDLRVRAFTKPNGGQASARNYALDRVKGDYVAFVDDDDWCDSQIFEYLVFLAESYDADIAGAKEYTTEIGKSSDITHVYTMKEYAKMLLPDEIGSHVLAQIFKRELFDGIRFPYSRSVEDMRLFTKIIERVQSIVKSEWELYHYTIHENNTSFIYAKTPSSSLDRSEAILERYQLVEKICPEKLPIIVMKSVTFGLGGIGMISKKDKDKYNVQTQKIIEFYKMHFEEIQENNKLDFGRKLAVLLIVNNINWPLRLFSCIKTSILGVKQQ